MQNRARLLAAAREVFAERGLDATLDDVAARAGLGTGTAYRHFRNKHELAGEVLAEATQAIADDATAALALTDPWAALVGFCEAVATRQAAERRIYLALAGQGRAADKARIWPDVVAAVTELVDRARAAGVVRPEVVADDVAAVLTMVVATFGMGEDAWRRYLALALDGLRSTDRPALPGPPPSFATLDDLIEASPS